MATQDYQLNNFMFVLTTHDNTVCVMDIDTS